MTPPLSTNLGAHIPLLYHFVMLQDRARMEAFKHAIAYAVKPGATVLELGGGTGVLSYFAAQMAAKVYCVEKIPENADTARRLLAGNPNGDRVEVICEDARDYLPPEPVDVVICEMLHVGMVREHQIEVIESFKRRYVEKFGPNLPRFVPEAFIQAVQPVSHTFDFFGYEAPVPLFQYPGAPAPECSELADPIVYQSAQYREPLTQDLGYQGKFVIRKGGRLNAVRFVLKNLVAIVAEQARAIHWHNHYLVVPIERPFDVRIGDTVDVSFAYRAGCEVQELMAALSVSKTPERLSLRSQVEVITYDAPPSQSPAPSETGPRVVRPNKLVQRLTSEH